MQRTWRIIFLTDICTNQFEKVYNFSLMVIIGQENGLTSWAEQSHTRDFLRVSPNFLLRTHESRPSLFEVIFYLCTLKCFGFWLHPLSLSLKFEEVPISGCWGIQLFIFWGHLTSEVVFISSILILAWSSELKSNNWGSYHQLLLRYSTFNILR